LVVHAPQALLTQAWPDAHWELVVQGPQAPLTQAWPPGHWLGDVQAPQVPSARQPSGAVHWPG
jgi:hypothetical protein